MERMEQKSENKMALFGARRFVILRSSKFSVEINENYLSGQIFQDSSGIYSGCSSNTSMASSTILQMSMNTTYRELDEN